MVNKFFWCIGIGILTGLVIGYFTKAILELTPVGFLVGFMCSMNGLKIANKKLELK